MDLRSLINTFRQRLFRRSTAPAPARNISALRVFWLVLATSILPHSSLFSSVTRRATHESTARLRSTPMRRATDMAMKSSSRSRFSPHAKSKSHPAPAKSAAASSRYPAYMPPRVVSQFHAPPAGYDSAHPPVAAATPAPHVPIGVEPPPRMVATHTHADQIAEAVVLTPTFAPPQTARYNASDRALPVIPQLDSRSAPQAPVATISATPRNGITTVPPSALTASNSNTLPYMHYAPPITQSDIDAGLAPVSDGESAEEDFATIHEGTTGILGGRLTDRALYPTSRLESTRPMPLYGSREILLHQNEMADAEGLERIKNDSQLARMARSGQLSPLPVSVHLTVDPRLPENRRFCRPWTAKFLADISAAFYARFGEPLQVNSAVRTVDVQQHLERINGNAAAATGELASPHLTGQAIDISKRTFSAEQMAWMREHLLPIESAGKIDVEEEFQQAVFHISVYKSYAPSKKPSQKSVPSPRMRADSPAEAANAGLD